MAETAMAETTSADFIVGLIMGNVVKKPARATRATEGLVYCYYYYYYYYLQYVNAIHSINNMLLTQLLPD